jgi:hypothetical protein
MSAIVAVYSSLTVDVVIGAKPLDAVIVFSPSIYSIDNGVGRTVAKKIRREKAKVCDYPDMPADVDEYILVYVGCYRVGSMSTAWLEIA